MHELTCGPTEVPIRATLLDRLGLPADADMAKVRTGYLRLGWGNTGGVELFDCEGTLSAAFQVGDAPVSALCMDYGQLRASYAGGLLTLFEGRRITGFVQLPEYFATLTACGSEVVVWGRQKSWVVDSRGRVVWRASFTKRIGSVVAEPLGFQMLAGKLFWFQRRGD